MPDIPVTNRPQQNTKQPQKPSTKEEWEILKIRWEIRKTEQEIASKNKPTRRIDLVKDWATTITTIVGIGGGVWGLFYGINTYSNLKRTEERRIEEERRFHFNEKMVAYVDSLETDQSGRSIMILKYFGKDAIPILLYKLERIEPISNNNIISAIIEIEKDAGEGNRVMQKIFTDMVRAFTFAKTENLVTDDIYPLRNYLDLAARLKPPLPDSVRIIISSKINEIVNEGTRDDLILEFNQIPIR